MEKSQTPSISEFLQIYPPISSKTPLSETKKYLVYFSRMSLKRKSTRRSTYRKSTLSKQNSSNNTNPDFEFGNSFLIDKAIEQQNNGFPRSQEIKDSLKSFLYQSNLISKLKNYFTTNDTNISDANANLHINFEENIKTVISKLADSVIMEKYPINKFVLRMNEIGRDCYFLISGKLSVLKPVEYQNIKISYNDYLLYLINLYNNNEMDLLKNVISMNNREFLKFHNLDKMLKDVDEVKIFIKSYCISKLYFKIRNNLINYKDLKILENELKEFGFTFLDYSIDDNEIEENMNLILTNKYDDRLTIEDNLKKYILKSFRPSEDDIYNMLPYEFLINDSVKESNNNTATLFKYDLFLYLYPGAFFGETALENISNNRRNATIRTEEDCDIISLNQKLYGSILYESTKLIKDLDIFLLRKHYFFNGIQSNIFNKLYFSMFKLISKNKNDIIFQQNSKLNSIYFLKEGEIKFETYLTAIDIHNIIKYYIDYMTLKKKYLKLSNEQIENLKKNYLSDKDLVYGENKGLIYKEKINEINKYEIYSTKNSECLGILEFSSLMDRYVTSCYVVSKTAKFFEINIENLKKIIKREREIILQDYYKLIKNKMLAQIKRLYFLKLNFLSNINYKINQNFYNISNNLELSHIKNFHSESNINNNKTNLNNSQNIIIENNNTIKDDIINKFADASTSTTSTNYIKIKKPLKNKLISKYFCHFNYEFNKNNNWSPVSLKCIKYNKNYFINEKLHINNKNNNIEKNVNHILNNSDCNKNYNDIIKTLLSFEPKKEKIDKYLLKSPGKELDLKKIINIGNNHIFTLEQLKSKIKKYSLSESMMNLSIVKNIHNKTMNPTNLKNKNEIKKSILAYKHKNNSLLAFKKIKLRKKYRLYNNDYSKNLSDINSFEIKSKKDIKKDNIQQIKDKYKHFNNSLRKAVINKNNKKTIVKKHFLDI